jgi:hypothetical protein
LQQVRDQEKSQTTAGHLAKKDALSVKIIPITTR